MRIALVVLALCLGVAAPAQAAPIVLDPRENAEKPDIAIDSTGAGHVVWNEATGNVDVIVYCRLPRGAKACDRGRRFTFSVADQTDTLRPRVLVDGSDNVFILSSRCCEGANRLYLIRSQDRGETFETPRVVGSNEPSGGAAIGPGQFTLSTITNITTGGTFFEAFPIDGTASGKANVGDNPAGSDIQSYGTLAVSENFTPIAAMSDVDRIYYRVGPGSQDYNTLSRWGPLKQLGPGTEPRLASGPRGVFLLYRRSTGGNSQLVMSRFDPATASFGGAIPVSESGSPLFADFWQDAGGRLHAVWQSGSQLKHAVSKDGATFPTAVTIGKAGEGSWNGNEVAAAEDGGGFAVSDSLNEGPILAVPFGPTGPVGSGDGDGDDGDCVSTFTMKTNAKVLASEGCFTKKGDVYTTTGDVRINGMDIVTPGSQAAQSAAARAAADVKVRIDRGTGEVTTKGTVTVKVGPVVLDKGEISWVVPAEAGKTFVKFPDIGQYKIEFLGFPVTGEAVPHLEKGVVEITGHLKMPAWLGNINADVVFTANQEGLQLQGFKIKSEGAKLGALLIKKLDVEYKSDKPAIFTGDVTFVLPPAYSETPAIRGYFSFIDGTFDKAGFNVGLPTPITLVPAPVPIFLTDFGFEFGINPYRIKGGVRLSAAQTIFLNALPPEFGIGIKFADPVEVTAAGQISLLSIPLGSGGIYYRVPDLLTFSGQAAYTVPFGLASFTGAVNGAVDMDDGRFNAEGATTVCVPAGGACLDGNYVLSTNGAAACASGSLEVVSGALGFAVTWEQLKKLSLGVDNVLYDFEVGGEATCDLGPWKDPGVGASAAQAGQPVPFEVPAGLSKVRIGLLGNDASPQVTFTAPDGRQVSTGDDPMTPTGDDRSYLYQVPQARQTILLVEKPPAGTWTVNLHEGSSDIEELFRSDGLPEPRVKARVTPGGQRPLLRYTIKKIPGQKITLSERSRNVTTTLAKGLTKSGRTRFTPGYGPREKRQIVATIESYGRPRDVEVVGSYTAPATARPAKPRVKLARKRSAVRVRWTRAARAVAYVVRVKLRDGTNRLYPTKKRTLTIRGVDARDVGSIKVAGVDRAGKTGRPGKARVRAKRTRSR